MAARNGPLHVSGIVVTTTAEHLDEVASALDALAGVEVHGADRASARLVVVQEAHGVDAEIDGMRRIQALPGVVDASLVYHYFGDALDEAPPAS